MTEQINAMDINNKISEIKKEIDKLKQAAELIPKYEEDLKALERTRSIFSSNTTHEPVTKINEQLVVGKRRQRENSLNVLSVKIINELNKPLHIDDIEQTIKDQGFEVNKGSLAAALSREKKKGTIKWVTHKTYAPIDYNALN